ncbi:MAG TPA: response regulator [Candidatus Competibacter sp.]|nr:response regulator [Candidatus Competibacter sp.]
MPPTTPHSNKLSPELSLMLIGFSTIEQTLVSGICKLSRFRTEKSVISQTSYRYYIVDINNTSEIDIFLVDADASDATKTRESIRAHLPNSAIVWVSNNNQQPGKPNEYCLARNRLGGLLLRLLDEISDARLQQTAPKIALKTCLVVDDSELMRAQMELILQGYGLGVAFAEDAETAIQMVKEQTFELIFLDVMLPEMDGYKACKLLKSDPKISKTPVVMLTSKRSPFNKMHGALVGCDRYLTKPVDPDKVRQVLEKYFLIDKNTAATIQNSPSVSQQSTLNILATLSVKGA